MTDSNKVNDPFDTLAKILLRCFILGYILLLLWLVVYLVAGGLVYGIGKLFGLTPHEVDVVNYCGLTFVKSIVLLFFLIPYIAIRLVMRKRT